AQAASAPAAVRPPAAPTSPGRGTSLPATGLPGGLAYLALLVGGAGLAARTALPGRRPRRRAEEGPAAL
ncbi:MAG: hypothetical protein M3N21_03920, partial [Actinomycetota bacterium]|nr:hypothetical protein [Actinomycetota bacterium]